MRLLSTEGAVMLVVFLLDKTVFAYKAILGNFKRQLAVTVGASFLVLSPIVASAQVDCNRNCFQNCTKVAPGSVEYCKSSCTEYCEQTDRQDGLSGSVDATKGETGLFGGSIDGTVVYGEDKPPKAFQPIPDFLLKGYNLKQTEFSRPRKVAPQ